MVWVLFFLLRVRDTLERNARNEMKIIIIIRRRIIIRIIIRKLKRISFQILASSNLEQRLAFFGNLWRRMRVPNISGTLKRDSRFSIKREFEDRLVFGVGKSRKTPFRATRLFLFFL